MAIFFFVVGLEIKRELVEGELRDPRTAALPADRGASAGCSCPPLIYVAINAGGDGAGGWGIPMATDIAMAIGVVSLLGSRGRAIAQALPARARDRRRHRRDPRDRGLLLRRDRSRRARGRGVPRRCSSALMRWAGVRFVAAYVLVGAGLWLALHDAGPPRHARRRDPRSHGAHPPPPSARADRRGCLARPLDRGDGERDRRRSLASRCRSSSGWSTCSTRGRASSSSRSSRSRMPASRSRPTRSRTRCTRG